MSKQNELKPIFKAIIEWVKSMLIYLIAVVVVYSITGRGFAWERPVIGALIGFSGYPILYLYKVLRDIAAKIE